MELFRCDRFNSHNWLNGDDFATVWKRFVHDKAVHRSEQGVIGTNSDIQSRFDVRAALADKDVTGKNCFPSITLDAEPLGRWELLSRPLRTEPPPFL